MSAVTLATASNASNVLDCAATNFAWDYLKANHHGSLEIDLAGNETRPGFRVIHATFQDRCGTMAFNPVDAQNGVAVSATVVNVTDMGNVAGDNAFSSLWLANCDKSSQLNVTSPGVYVITGTLAMVIPERQPKAGADSTACVGKSVISYEASSLDDYCRVDATLPECSKGPPTTSAPVPAPSSTTPPRSTRMGLVAVAMLALTASLVV